MPTTQSASAFDLVGGIERSFAAHASRTALETHTTRITYGQLRDWVGAIARSLGRIQGDGRSVVAVCSQDTPSVVAAMLAIFRTGNIYVPLDPNGPHAKRQSILEQTRPRLVLLDSQAQRTSAVDELMRSGAVACVEIPGLPHRGSDQGQPERYANFLDRDLEAPAYIFHTSGSTGKPKGIVGKLSALGHFVDWEISQFGIRPGDRISQFTSLTFDASFRDILTPLCAGATICVPPVRATQMDAVSLLDWIEQSRVSLIHCVPSLFGAMLEGNWRERECPDLKYILMAGEALPLAHAREWIGRFGDRIRLVNLYGSTETTMVKMFHVVTREDLERGFIPVGRPLPKTRVAILDQDGKPSPPGEQGEIHIITPHRSLGYLNDAKATARAFARIETGAGESVIAHRTGDVGLELSDGSIRFMGRKDRLVKIHGVRVELGEVEAALSAHPEVQACAVAMRKDRRSCRRLIAKESVVRSQSTDAEILVAYVIARNEVSEETLRAFLADRLAQAVLPTHFVMLPAMPLNSNGKIDYRALPEPDGSRKERRVQGELPKTNTECQVAAIWAQVLQVEAIGRDDDFFVLGGDSLRAMQVLNRVRAASGRPIPIPDLFKSSTLASFATLLDSRGISLEQEGEHESGASDPGEDAPGLESGDYPLTPAQRGLWFLWKMDPRSPYYTCQGLVHLRGRMDAKALERAWSALLAKHEILRVRFREVDGEPVQRFDGELPALPATATFGLAAEEDRLERVRREMRREMERPFDLKSDRLLRVSVYQLSDAHHVIALTMHEITVDLWTIRLLIRDLGNLYTEALNDARLPLCRWGGGFWRYLSRHYTERPEEDGETGDAYWKSELAGELPVLALPLDRERSATPSFRGATRHVLLDPALTGQLREFGHEQGCTLFMTLLSGFFLLLNRYAGQNDFVIGTPLAQRNHADTEALAGFFLNMLPIRARIDPNASVADFLEQIRTTVSGALAQGNYPFSRMLEWARSPRDTSFSPVFQVMFNMLGYVDEQIAHDDFELAYESLETGYTKYDLSVYAQECGDRLFLQIAFQTELFDDSSIERMLNNLVATYRELVQCPDTRLSKLWCLDERERAQLLEHSNPRSHKFPWSGTLVSLFDEQVAKSPCAPALCFRDEIISYAELDEQAESCAGRLTAAGVSPGSIIGLHMRRSPDLVAAVLAVLRVGAVYLLLDPSQPEQRLRTIAADAKPVAILADADMEGDLGLAFKVLRPFAPGKRGSSGAGGSVRVETDAESIATVIHTSASTGKPKGVMISQGAILNRLFWMWEEYPFDNDEVMILQKALSLVAATWECFGGLLRGVPTVIAAHDEVRDPRAFSSLCHRWKVTRLFGSPALFQGVLAERERDAGCFTTLRFAASSAEAIPPRMVREWQRLFPKVRLLNLYGSSECSSNVTQFDCRDLGPSDVRVPIGKPIPNTRVRILDANRRPVPLGALGEMHISGACLASGYLNLPEKTQECFVGEIPDEDPKLRWYRSGDVARLRADGNFELIGRNDFQVKIRGFRIEPEEIEQVVIAHPKVHVAAVIAETSTPQEAKLVLHYSADPDLSESDLRAFVRERLPDYMLPAEWNRLNEIPRTATGKIDRRSLRAVPVRRTRSIRADEASSSDLSLEGSLLSLWRRVLGDASVGLDDDFFDAGGHSLMAARLFAEIEATTGRSLPISILYRAPTVRGLASLLRDQGWETFHNTLIPIRARGRKPPLFCVPPWTGSTIYFRDLSIHLDPEIPIFGFEPRDWRHEEFECESVGEIADRYVADINAFRPAGPICLGGFSGGGLVAWEMARRMRATGRDVRTVILFDTWKPIWRVSEDAALGRWRRTIRQLSLHREVLRHRAGVKRKGAYVTFALQRKVRSVFERTVNRRQSSDIDDQLQIQRSFYRRFEPDTYDGDVLLLRAREQRYVEAELDRSLGWEDLADGGLTIREIPGRHQTMLLEPNAGPLCRAINDHLAGLEAEPQVEPALSEAVS